MATSSIFRPFAKYEAKQTALQVTTNSRHMHVVGQQSKPTTFEEDEIAPLMLFRGMR